jgi:hypothetical protein
VVPEENRAGDYQTVAGGERAKRLRKPGKPGYFGESGRKGRNPARLREDMALPIRDNTQPRQ